MKIVREYIKCLLLFIGGVLGRALFRKRSVLTSMLVGGDTNGPGRFLRNLSVGLEEKSTEIVRNPLLGGRTLLVISSMPIFMYRLMKIIGVKTVLRVDGFSYPNLYNNCQYNELENRELRTLTLTRIRTNYHIQAGLSLADWVVYQSEFSMEMSAKWLFNRIDAISIIPNGVDTNLFRPIGNDIDGENIISIHGNLHDVDIIRCAFKIFCKLKEQYNQRRFRLIGRMTDTVSQEVSLLCKKNEVLGSSLEVVGPVSAAELSKLLPEASLSLHLTSADSCPNSVLESLACGVPVVCQAYGGQSELVGDAGVVVDSGKEYDYSDKVVQLVVDAVRLVLADLRTYKRRARERAVVEFSTESMAARYGEVFDKVQDL